MHGADKLLQRASSVYDLHKKVSSIPSSQGSPFIVVIFLPVLYYNWSCAFSKLPGSRRSFMQTSVSRNKPFFQVLNFFLSAGLLRAIPSSPTGTSLSLKWESHSVIAVSVFFFFFPESLLWWGQEDQIKWYVRQHLPLYFRLTLKGRSMSLFTMLCHVKRRTFQKPDVKQDGGGRC